MYTKMKQHLTGIDDNKLDQVIAIKQACDAGKLSLEECHRRIHEVIGELRPSEIAYMEQKLNAPDDDECRRENIKDILKIYGPLASSSEDSLDSSHPLERYRQENRELEKLLIQVDDLVQYPVIKNQWAELLERLSEVRIHYARKQNQLYAALEKKGFDKPTTTMWTYDDALRDEISRLRSALDHDFDDAAEEEFIASCTKLAADMRDLIEKEEIVLYPTARELLSDEDFAHMQLGDAEIGYAWIRPDDNDDAGSEVAVDERDVDTVLRDAPAGLVDDICALMAKHGFKGFSNGAELDVAHGKLTLDQINLIFRHLPVDLSYVDEHELVKFYSDSPHRVFPRSRNVIGRNVMNCHPRSSVHIVREIVDKFRSGEQDRAEFWINKPDLFIYIVYVAVRDDDGVFRGILEMMQDCTHIRQLVGSQTLLTWSKDSADEQTSEEEEELGQDVADTCDTSHGSEAELTKDTRIADLFNRYPGLKEELISRYSELKVLNSPLAKIMLPKATLGIMATRLSLPLADVIASVREAIAVCGE